jgi:hypothetical protein
MQGLYVIVDAAGEMFRESSGEPQEKGCFVFLEEDRARWFADAPGKKLDGYEATWLLPGVLERALTADEGITHVGYFWKSLPQMEENPGGESSYEKAEFTQWLRQSGG